MSDRGFKVSHLTEVVVSGGLLMIVILVIE